MVRLVFVAALLTTTGELDFCALKSLVGTMGDRLLMESTLLSAVRLDYGSFFVLTR